MDHDQYVITDGRDLDRAVVCEVCETKREAMRERSMYGRGAAVYRIPAGSTKESEWELIS